MNKLPDKKSDLLILALEDYFKVKSDLRYTIDMTYWHAGNSRNTLCPVCLAGSVMAKSLQVPIGDIMHPEAFNNKEIEGKLKFLNSIRRGQLFIFMNDHADLFGNIYNPRRT